MSQIFPVWMYHKTKAPEGKLILDQGEFDALGDSWKETPAAFDQESDEASEKTEKDPDITKKDFTKMKVAELKEILIEKGVPAEEVETMKKDELIAKLGAI